MVGYKLEATASAIPDLDNCILRECARRTVLANKTCFQFEKIDNSEFNQSVSRLCRDMVYIFITFRT